MRHIVAGMGNVPVSLDSGKTDLAAQALTMKEEREEKCGGTDEVYYDYAVWLMVAKDDGSTKVLEDLAGLKVFGQATTQAIEAYHEENPEKTVELGYVGSTTEQVVPVIDNDTLKAWFTIGYLSGFRNFNSRPYGRGDKALCHCVGGYANFNSRPYGRGDGLVSCIPLETENFNSRPYGRATLVYVLRFILNKISIHAPTGGATPISPLHISC